MLRILPILLIALLAAANASAEVRPDRVHAVEGRKAGVYVDDGIYAGGDHAIEDVNTQDIRRASNRGFERIVIDLTGTSEGESVAIPRPPYYQVSISPDEQRVLVTLWGNPKLSFNARKVLREFSRSPSVKKIDLYPKLEADSWTFALELKSARPVEVFDLANPVRIILDIRSQGK
jgi:hypothetical protein